MRSCNLIGTGSSSCAAISTFAIGKLASIVLLVATAMILSLWSDPDAWASDEVPIHFQTGAPPDGAWPVIERWMRALDEDPPYNFDLLQDHLDRTVQFGWAKNTDDALADFLNHEIFWAYVDLDGDGIDEMMVFIAIGPYCGTDGCGMIELHRSGSGWRIEDGISMSDTNDLCYRRNGPNGLPMFRTQSEVFWWSAGRLNGACYAYCSHWWDRDAIDPDELARMTPEKLAVRNEIREEPWCATGSAN